MSPRRLVPVVLDSNVETGDQLPVPHLGEIATYAVGFSDATENTDPDDPGLITGTAHIEDRREGRPVHGRRRVALPPGATESGRLIELDLDDVPDGRTGGTHLDPQPMDSRPRPGRSSRGSG